MSIHAAFRIPALAITGLVSISLVAGGVPANATVVPQSLSVTPFAPEIVPQSVRLIDISSNPFRVEIQWLADKGVTTGYPDGTYRPLQSINRDAMAAFLYRMAGSPSYSPPTKSPFIDVSTKQQFYKEMAWVASRGISTGWSNGNGTASYRPLTPISRDAMAAFLYRFAGKPVYTPPSTSRFKDMKVGQQFYKETSWLAAKNISTGWPDGTYRPLQPIARDAMAAFLYRYTFPNWNAPKPNPGKAIYLDTIKPTQGRFNTGPAIVGGASYARSIQETFWRSTWQQTVQYSLGGTYDRLQLKLGVADDSYDSNAHFRVLFYGDGRIIGTQDVKFNQVVDINYSVRGVNNLRIEVSNLVRSEAEIVLGNAQLVSGVVPRPGAPAAGAPATTFLAHLRKVSGTTLNSGVANIGAETYQSSASVRFFRSTKSTTTEYDLGRKYARYQTTLGLQNSSLDATAIYQVQVFVDGAEVADVSVATGKPIQLDVSINNGLRLKFVITKTFGGESTITLGNARLLS